MAMSNSTAPLELVLSPVHRAAWLRRLALNLAPQDVVVLGFELYLWLRALLAPYGPGAVYARNVSFGLLASSAITIALCRGELLPPGPPRLCGPVPDLSRDIALQVSEEMGQSVAILLDDEIGVPEPLPVCGQTITIPAATLTALANARIGADVIILDAANSGYRIRILCDAEQGTLSLAVY